MGQVKKGASQFDTPAPLGYRRFQNAMILFIIPAAVSLVQGWGFTDSTTNKVLLVLAFVPALIKGVGLFLGNGQEFVPSNLEIDKQNIEEKIAAKEEAKEDAKDN